MTATLPALDRNLFPTVLYRIFDHDDVLLYVGVSASLFARFRNHAGHKKWWSRVDMARTTYEWFPNRTLALVAERQAILGESPLFNVLGSDEDGYLRRLEAEGNVEMIRHVRLLTQARREYDEAGELLRRHTAELHVAMADLYRTGEYTAAEIGRRVGYTPEHVRRILRAAGIQGDPTRLTPAQRAALTPPETETGRQ